METYFILKESGSYPSGWLLDGVKMAERCSLAIPTVYYTIIKTLKVILQKCYRRAFFWFPKEPFSGFISCKHIFCLLLMLTDGLECCGLLRCVYQTLILTAPIHCRASIAETLMQCYISPNLMKKQTHLHLGWPEGENIFWTFILPLDVLDWRINASKEPPFLRVFIPHTAWNYIEFAPSHKYLPTDCSSLPIL